MKWAEMSVWRTFTVHALPFHEPKKQLLWIFHLVTSVIIPPCATQVVSSSAGCGYLYLEYLSGLAAIRITPQSALSSNSSWRAPIGGEVSPELDLIPMLGDGNIGVRLASPLLVGEDYYVFPTQNIYALGILDEQMKSTKWRARMTHLGQVYQSTSIVYVTPSLLSFYMY